MNQAQRKLRLAVLLSGGGTNLQALLDRFASGVLKGEVAAVVSDRPDAYGLVRAQNAGVDTHVVDYGRYAVRDAAELAGLADGAAKSGGLPVDLEELDQSQKIIRIPDRTKRLLRLAGLVRAEQALISLLEPYEPDYVCLAGYMRLVSPHFLNHYNRRDRWRVLNIHPALLPAFPGQHGYEDTFAYGCKWGGITVHFVDEGEDSGPVIAQAVYPIWPRDDIEQVRARGLKLEYEVYSQCINWLAAGQVEVERGGGTVGAGITTRVHITDPSYADIVRGWTRMAFE
jgi:phosphoribosylglycinamide formyltransferase-1